MKTIHTLAILLIAQVLFTAVLCEAVEPRTITFQTQTMGTTATLILVTPDSTAVADLAYQSLLSLHQTDSLMTNWTTTSETARINRLAPTETVHLTPAFNHLLTTAVKIGTQSEGTFDITVEPLVRLWGFLDGTPAVPTQEAITTALKPVGWSNLVHDPNAATIRFQNPQTRIDLGGIAKGYGVDKVADILRKAGVTNALINLSGNMVALGAPPNKTAWTLGITDPENRDDYLARVRLTNQAIATSGNYFQHIRLTDGNESVRFGHILDPRTGWPSDGMASATVIAPDATTADAWATAFIVMNAWRARQIAQDHDELHVILIEQASASLQVVWVEESLREKFAVPESRVESLTVRYF